MDSSVVITDRSGSANRNRNIENATPNPTTSFVE
jgi:hypothetical protein